MPHVIAWDLETIADISGFALANDLVGKLPDEVRGAMGDKFPKHIYHEIICIGAQCGDTARVERTRGALDASGRPADAHGKVEKGDSYDCTASSYRSVRF